MTYLFSAPAVGQSHSGLLPSTAAGPREHQRTTRNYELGEGRTQGRLLTRLASRTSAPARVIS
jgi:hypothetical protein